MYGIHFFVPSASTRKLVFLSTRPHIENAGRAKTGVTTFRSVSSIPPDAVPQFDLPYINLYSKFSLGHGVRNLKLKAHKFLRDDSE
jgi:hypothetical protein